VIGVCDGQENNTFYRRSGNTLEKAGGKDLKTGDTVVLGEDAIHAIENPSDRPMLRDSTLMAVTFSTSRNAVCGIRSRTRNSRMISKLIRDYARQLMAQ